MRHLSVFLLALLPLAAMSQSAPQWEVLPASPFNSYRFEDAAFVSPEAGWIVNGSGEVWGTTDGGNFWALRSDVPGYLRSTAFPTAAKGWVGVLFSDAKLYEARSGGLEMVDVTSRIQPAIFGGICGLWAVDAFTVYGVGQYSEPAFLIKTTDGGQSWVSQDMTSHVASLIDVYFWDADHGIVVGGSRGVRRGGQAVILATDDGGATWTERGRSSGVAGASEWGWKISFPTPEVGYVSVETNTPGSSGKVLKTTDGGATWIEIGVPGVGNMQGIGFITPDIGWISGRGFPVRTLDGGATWTQDARLDGNVNRFEFFGDTLGYAMGREIYKLNRPTSTESAPGPKPLALTLRAVPNPASGAVTFHVQNASEGRLTVFDALGREVTRLDARGVDRDVRWDTRGLPSGVYIARLVTQTDAVSTRVVLQ